MTCCDGDGGNQFFFSDSFSIQRKNCKRIFHVFFFYGIYRIQFIFFCEEKMKISVVLHRQRKRVFDDVLIISLDMHEIPDLKTSHTELEFIPKISWELWDFFFFFTKKKKILIWIKCVQVSEWKWKKKFNQKLNSVIIFFFSHFFDSLKKNLTWNYLTMFGWM